MPRFHFLHALALIVLVASPLSAQSTQSADPATPTAQPNLPEPLTRDAVHEMVARMSDDQVRALLLERLDAVAADQPAGLLEEEQLLVTRIGITWNNMVAQWADAIRKLPTLVSGQVEAFSNFGQTYGAGGLLKLFGYMAIVLAIGYAAERVVVFLTRRRLGRETGQESANLRSAIGFLFRRFCRELLGLLVFYMVIKFVGSRLLGPQELTFAGPFVFYLVWIPRLGAAMSRFILAPKRSALRMVNVQDRWARFLHRNLIGLFILIGFVMFIIGFDVRNGVSAAETRIGFWLNTAIHIYIGLIAWIGRDGLREMMRGTDPDRTRLDEKVAYYYPGFVIAVSAFMWLVVEVLSAQNDPKMMRLLVTGPHFVTIFWLVIAPALDSLIRGLVRHLQPPMIGTGEVAERAYQSTKRSYINIGRVIAGVIVVMMIARAWNLNLRSLAATGIGESFAGALVPFLVIVGVGYIANEAVSLWINRRLAREQTQRIVTEDQASGEGGGSGGSRLATVLPLMRISAQVAITVVFGLLAIGSLGIDITPLMAGAGVIGLAIGFGAQKLVTDIVSGVFFLIDDAFRVGEYVDVGGTMGTVEKISVRSMQLRHHRGAVHTIPYGAISKLTNFSRDWAIMKLMFTVPFDTDPDKIKKIFKKIGAEMMEDPVFKDGFLEPFKSQGVFDFDDIGMVIRGKFMARPGTQFTIRKEIYNRVKAEFNAAGIEFARREVRVAIPNLDEHENLTEEQKTTIGAAVAGAVQQQKDEKK